VKVKDNMKADPSLYTTTPHHEASLRYAVTTLLGDHLLAGLGFPCLRPAARVLLLGAERIGSNTAH
jgi:hypothetical protein